MEGMILLGTKCSPIRISISNKDVMSVYVTVKNSSDSSRLISLEMRLPGELGMDPSGISHSKSARLGEIPPGESKEVRFDVHPTHKTIPGETKPSLTIVNSLFTKFRSIGAFL